MQTGVIGLGAMGAPMAFNLHRAGLLHRVWNRSPDKARRVAEQTGVTVAQSPEELAQSCDLIIVSVSRDADVLEVGRRIAAAISPGAIVVDTSTVAASTAREVAALLAERDAHFLDAPVSGGVEGAKNASLAIMIGGDAEVLQCAQPALSAIARHVAHLGPVGSGQACKAVNQLMVAGINQAVSEALAFGERMGLDMQQVVDIVATGAAGNWFLEHRGKTMLAGRYDPGFKLALHHKDLTICRAMLREAGAPALSLIEATLCDYQPLIEQGYGEEDISALLRLKREQLQ